VHRNGAAKVVDFGIAKAANSSSQTRTGTLKGKVAYMPPEQLRGEQLDRRTDVFALGVVLYELIAGRRPWEGTSEVALIGKIMTEEPQPLAEVRSDVPPELVAIVDRALAKDREQRFQSCHELQADLENLLMQMGQTITPARVSDFVKAYSPDAHAPTAGLEPSSAEIRQVEDEMNGTGAAPALVKGRGAAHDRDSRTVAMAAPPRPPASNRGLLYGVIAFLVIAVGGGAGGYWFFFQQSELAAAPVTVERATVVEQEPPPKPAESAAKPAEPAAKPAEPASAAAAEPAKAADPVKPRPRRVAAAEPAPVVVVRDVPQPPPAPAPEAPRPTVTAKGELVLLIRPWAKVEVDGREVGITPLNEPLMLVAGDHQVRLINTDLQKDITRTVHITAAEREVLKEILDE
jgi:serine/threonine-protein kinase